MTTHCTQKDYTNALVLGKFMNFHVGHESLIREALSLADKVVVLLVHSESDPIPKDTRYGWIHDTFGSSISLISLDYAKYGLEDKEDSDRDISKAWATWVDKHLPKTDLIVGSENYVTFMAEYGGFDSHIYDLYRVKNPCSSTAVREGDFKWYTHAAKESLVKKVYILGPESSGKTTMTNLLSDTFKTSKVLEQARNYLNDDGHYCRADLKIFLNAQRLAIDLAVKNSESPLCIIDTSPITTMIYESMKFYTVSVDAIKDGELKEGIYIVLSPDIPWVDDGTRHMSQQNREYVFYKTIGILRSHSCEYYVIGGTSFEDRLLEAENVIRNIQH